MREVIEGPARLAKLDVREVTALMLEDARDELGALPLVENALFTLWQKREGNRLSGDEYRQQSGIAGMLSTQADALLARIDAEVPNGRQAALELLLRLTRINDEGRHTRQRITRQEAVMIAGNGNEADGERVVQLLSGERTLDGRSTQHAGALRLITTHGEQGEQYVDLIHETLIRARGKDEKTGKLIGYWPTLYDYIEANRDRDIHRQQLKFQTEQWLQARGLGRFTNLAGWRDLRRYRPAARPRRKAPEGRFLGRSRWGVRREAGSGRVARWLGRRCLCLDAHPRPSARLDGHAATLSPGLCARAHHGRGRGGIIRDGRTRSEVPEPVPRVGPTICGGLRSPGCDLATFQDERSRGDLRRV